LISNIWDKPADDLNESEETPAQPFIVRDDDTYPRNYDWFGGDLSTVISYDPKDLEWLNDIHDNTRRPYPEHYAERFWKPSAIKINSRFLPTYLTQQHWELLPFLPKIPRQEVDLLHDMLTKVFMYGPEERISAEDIMGHPWFRMNEGEALHKEKAPILSRMFNT
jgi:serine/threonine protein kinase